MTVELKPAAEPIFEAHAVWASYDGNAPDTSDLVLCSTLELADKLATILNGLRPDDEDDEETGCNKSNGIFTFEGTEYALSHFPFVDGWEHSKTYETRLTWAPARNIVMTIEEALNVLCG